MRQSEWPQRAPDLVAVPAPRPPSSPAATGGAGTGRRGAIRLVRRALVGLVGALVVAVGVVLLPLPGPGWLVIFAGLALLGTEFAWARRLLVLARARVGSWTRWVQRQSGVVRLAVASGGLLLVALVALSYTVLVGIPTWLPPASEAWLQSWVPDLG